MIRLVAGREISERVRARSYLVGTGLLVALILAMGLLGRLAADDGPGPIDIGVATSPSDAVEASLSEVAEAAGREATVTFFATPSAARAALDDGEVDVVIDPQEHRAVFRDDVDDTILAVVQQAWSRMTVEEELARAGLGPAEIGEVMAVAPLEVTSEDDDGSSGLGVLIGTVAVVLLFMSLQTFGTYVLTGVVEEKSSAVVEVLLVRARADQLLAGKVIGIGVAALGQFTAAVAAGLGALALSGVEVPGEIWSSVPLLLVWFLGGFALYSTLFALAGSLVSRQEDAQAAAAPIGYGLVGSYLLVFAFGYVPDSTASTVLSLLPPFAPFLMPMRMAAGAASVVEVVVALAGLLAATLAAWKVAGRIYEQVLLRRGARIAWREALALLRDRPARPAPAPSPGPRP